MSMKNKDILFGKQLLEFKNNKNSGLGSLWDLGIILRNYPIEENS